MKHILCLLTALALMLTLLVGCAGQNAAPETDPVPPAGEQETDTPADSEPTPPAAESEPADTETPPADPEPDTPEVPAEPAPDLEAVYQAVLDLQADTGLDELIMMPSSDAVYLDNFYPGLSSVALNQLVAYMAPVTNFACEIVLVEVSDPADAEAVAELFQARIDNQAENGAYPETEVLWQRNGQVHTLGNCVCMIVLPDGYVIPDNVFELEI